MNKNLLTLLFYLTLCSELSLFTSFFSFKEMNVGFVVARSFIVIVKGIFIVIEGQVRHYIHYKSNAPSFIIQ